MGMSCAKNLKPSVDRHQIVNNTVNTPVNGLQKDISTSINTSTLSDSTDLKDDGNKIDQLLDSIDSNEENGRVDLPEEVQEVVPKDMPEIPKDIPIEDHLDAIKKCAHNITEMDRHLLDNEELCLSIAKLNWITIQYIPQTVPICIEVLKQNPYSLKYISLSKGPLRLPPELYKALKNATNQCPSILQYVSDDLFTPEMCMQAVNHEGINIRFVKQQLQTKELCSLAITQNPAAIKYVRDDLYNDLACELIKQNGLNIQYITKILTTGFEIYAGVTKWRSDEVATLFALKAVKQNGLALEFIFKEPFYSLIHSIELIIQHAIKQNVMAIKYVPEKYQSIPVCADA
jgi:hypothetical protein